LRTANQRLAEANEELAGLRRQVTATRELEQRVQQLEAEKTAAVASANTGPTRDELARAAAAQAAAEDKLGTALRAYTQLTRERDDLRSRLADLSAKLSSATESLAAAEARARTTAATNSAVTLASAELETLRNRADAAERAAETARTEAERANQLLGATRPATSAPTRPTVTPGRPARTHTIAPGETLSSIALRYYGTAARWPEILAANRDVLPDERSFVVGRTLRIP
jgi:nucleoid-associated protein YgaU